jgi:outer membrane protein assembly factor BamB
MRVVRKIATTVLLFGFPLALASGCAPAGPSAALTPATSMSLSPQSSRRLPADSNAAKAPQWLQFGYDAGHGGFNPSEKTINAQNVSNLAIAWNDQSIIQPGGIVVDKGVAYVDDMGQSNQGLYALDASTGAQKWYANVNLNGPWGSFTHAVAAVAGKVIVTPCSNGSSSTFLTGLCGVSAKNGNVLWTTYCTQYQGNPCGGLSNAGTSPTFYKNRVYVAIVNGVNEQPDTEALNPKTGKIVWDVAGEYHCPDAGLSSDNPLPAINGRVFTVLGCQGPSGSTEICALSAASGSTEWCDQSPSAYVQNMIAESGKLYVVEPGSSNNAVVALNAATGAQEWSGSIPGSNSAALGTANNRVFVEDGSQGVFALSAANGKTLWSYTANANVFQNGVLSVANGLVYTDGGGGNNGNVAIAAFNETNGNLVWTSGSVGNGGAPATPVILDGTIYAGCYTICSFTLSGSKSERKR